MSSKNNNDHQYSQNIFLHQPHPAPDQQGLTIARTQADKHAESTPSAFPRGLPRHAAGGIPRDTAPQEAFSTPQLTQAYSTPSGAPRHGDIHTLHTELGVPPTQSINTGNLEPRSDAQRPHGGVRQDKARLKSARAASPQPAPVTKVTRALFTNTSNVRSQNGSGASQRRQRVTLWVDPRVKTHLARLAEQEGLTVSAAGSTFLERALQQNIDLAYGALLTPIIETAIARQMRGIATRLAWLLVRIAFDSGQTRSLVTNILGRQTGMNDELLKTILVQSGKTAKANITRRTPQISELIESVEQWILKDADGGNQTQ